MKKLILLLFLLPSTLKAQGIIQFKINKPYALLNFIETAVGKAGTSSTLRDTIFAKTKNNPTFKKSIEDFRKINLDYSFKREAFPENRRQHRSTYDLLMIAAVKSNTLDELRTNAMGILPVSDLDKFIYVLKQNEKLYDDIIWTPSLTKLETQKKNLENLLSKANTLFTAYNHFYDSSWPADLPFIVNLYPIPGVKGNTTASPHMNSLCVGVLTDEEDPSSRMGVVLHEICHVLYDEQTAEVQHTLSRYFENTSSAYKDPAQNYIDEALATALGNGHAYAYFMGTEDQTEWYNDTYINGYAKVLYPMVCDYIKNSKKIDEPFIKKAVDIFGETFKTADKDYGLLFNKLSIFSNAETPEERGTLFNELGSRFRLYSSMMSTPILDKESLELIQKTAQTRLIIIDREHKKIQKALRKIFPELKNTSFIPNEIYAFKDKQNVAVIILNAPNKEAVPMLIDRMKKEGSFK